MMRCQAQTLKSRQCKNCVSNETNFCSIHSTKNVNHNIRNKILLKFESESESEQQPKKKATAHSRAQKKKLENFEKEFWNQENQLDSLTSLISKYPKDENEKRKYQEIRIKHRKFIGPILSSILDLQGQFLEFLIDTWYDDSKNQKLFPDNMKTPGEFNPNNLTLSKNILKWWEKFTAHLNNYKPINPNLINERYLKTHQRERENRKKAFQLYWIIIKKDKISQDIFLEEIEK